MFLFLLTGFRDYGKMCQHILEIMVKHATKEGGKMRANAYYTGARSLNHLIHHVTGFVLFSTFLRRGTSLDIRN